MGEMLNKMLEGASEVKRRSAYLRDKSSFYPKIYSEKFGDELYLSTIVRVNRNGIWYDIHHIECTTDSNYSKTYERLIESVYFAMLFFVPSEIFHESKVQILEQERVEKDYPYLASLNKQ